MSVDNNQKDFSAVLTFLQRTKDGEYVEIDHNIVEIPRNSSTRDEYVFADKELSVYFSMSN